jgi:pyruvate kinase
LSNLYLKSDVYVGRLIAIFPPCPSSSSIQVGEFSNPDGELLQKGQTFRLDLDEAKGDSTRVMLPHPEIITASEVGHTLMVDDGKVRLTVTGKGDDYLDCMVECQGKISNRKGVNTPDSILKISPLTPKDRSDLDYMLEIGVDWVALSFVQQPADIDEINAIIDAKIPEGNFKPCVMAKIEKPSCFDGDNLERLVEKCDGIMVARGDLGVECPPEDVPILQKKIIDECRKQGRPVVVATQMLESMIESPTPTRAEASDVATAIYDGADAIMLSAESAAGMVRFTKRIDGVSFVGVSIPCTHSSIFCFSVVCSTRKSQWRCNNVLLTVSRAILTTATTLMPLKLNLTRRLRMP